MKPRRPGSGFQLFGILQIIKHHHQPRAALEQLQEAVDFAVADARCGHQNVFNTARRHGFGLAQGCAADAAGPGGNLPFCNFHTFMGFGMRSKSDAVILTIGRHSRHIAFEGIQINHQCRCI